MDGGAGNDTLTSGPGNDTMLGSGGDDNYVWPPGTLTDVWDGGAGNDTATIIGNDSFMGAPGGSVRPVGQRFACTVPAREPGAVLKPGAGDDVVTVKDLTGVTNLKQVSVEGGLGNDVISGARQANALDRGDGNDSLTGGAGKDTLNGGDGNDDLNGGAGRDILYGGKGDDRLNGGADLLQDYLIGGDGADGFTPARRDSFVDFDGAGGDFEISNLPAS